MNGLSLDTQKQRMNKKKYKTYREAESEKIHGKLPYRKRIDQEKEALKQIEELYDNMRFVLERRVDD